MFRWAIIFAVVALVAALLGFGGIAGLSADFGKNPSRHRRRAFHRRLRLRARPPNAALIRSA